MPLQPNPGYLPDDCIIRNEAGDVVDHRRVRAVLFGGYDTRHKEPAGWPSGGRGACSSGTWTDR